MTLTAMTQFITAEELSKILRISKRSIYQFAKEGMIPGTLRIGKHWRFRRDLVEKWIVSETKSKKANINLK